MPTNQVNRIQATAGALQQAKAAPQQAPQQAPAQQSQDPQAQQPQQPGQPTQNNGDDASSQMIMQNLESHLNSIDPQQQRFLADALQHYANIVIPVLGIVCGKEVYQYFVQLYQQHFAKGTGQPPQDPNQQQQPNSAPAPQGQGPNSSPAPQQDQGQPQAAQAPDDGQAASQQP